jgi:hypothetical protein
MELYNRRTVMTKTLVIVSSMLLVTSMSPANPPPPGARARHADRNRDGVVTPREIRGERNWEHAQKAKVDTPWEARADRNQDGVVEPREAARMNSIHYFRNCSLVDRPWEAAADINKDGRVDRSELHLYHQAKLDADHDGVISLEERRVYWIHKNAVVNTPEERRYDTNKDGYLSWQEGREMLKDRLIIINTDGRAVVTNELEFEFDANKDGVIDREEAKRLKDVLAAP